MPAGLRTYLYAFLACVAATMVAWPLAGAIDVTNIAMVQLLVVAVVAARFGSGPAVLASVTGVALFDFFFVPPQFSWSVADAQYLITFAVMLVVGLLISRLTSRLAERMRDSERRERRTQALYGMACELSGVLTEEQVLEVVSRFVAEQVGAQVCLHLEPLDAVTPDVRVVCETGIPVELSGTTLLLPLRAPVRTRGVLQIEAASERLREFGEERPLLEAVASLVAIAIERIHYVTVAQQATLHMESERLRATLLSAVSHDIRTPLTVMVGLSDSLALANPPLAADQGKTVSALREHAMRLVGLVENLLQMARLQAGRAVLRREWQPLEEVLGASLQSMDALIGQREVVVEVANDLPLLEFDAVLIERVFCNLIENAAKYAPDSPIEIHAATNGSEVEISVCDRGPGLPAGSNATIFGLFERGGREGDGSGVGIGLAICRAIVEAHGGRIQAHNRDGGGVCFTFALPQGLPPRIEDPDGD